MSEGILSFVQVTLYFLILGKENGERNGWILVAGKNLRNIIKQAPVLAMF